MSVSSSLVFLIMALNSNTSQASSVSITPPTTIVTLIYSLYLPIISSVLSCITPPSGTVAIAGQAAVHGNSVGSGIPFILSYWPYWEVPSEVVLTMTTPNDGSFCSGPVAVLANCHGMWDEIYQPDSSWWKQLFACESGGVYTITAEIGK